MLLDVDHHIEITGSAAPNAGVPVPGGPQASTLIDSGRNPDFDAVGGLLIIDGTQSIGALPFSIKKYRPDALICAGYKWLMFARETSSSCPGQHTACSQTSSDPDIIIDPWMI